VKHARGLIFGQRACDQPLAGDVAVDHVELGFEACVCERRARRLVAAHDAHSCAALQERLDEPRAEQAVSAGDEDRVSPQVAQFHSFQGACPDAHSSLSSTASL
jgi:hypothetical protein